MASLSYSSTELDAGYRSLGPVGRLQLLRSRVPGALVFTTSFGLEDQVLLHLIADSGITARVVTLDTGRLFAETYALWARTEVRYGLTLQAFYPETQAVEALVAGHGINGFYRSKAAREACCGVRKLEPLDRALHGAAAWITGLRADQSAARRNVPFVSFDPARGLLKACPLLDWSRDRTAAFARAQDIPINDLHASGFLSIGCAPCTRAVAPGHPERAGRWWWEEEEDGAKECGLHVAADGRLVRVEA